jgi:DNA modification methylase/DNA-binding XRE family transcriptional regulator
LLTISVNSRILRSFFVIESAMSWSASVAIRARRDSLNISQADLAAKLGVTKSHLSLMEAGKRQPTEDQIAFLSHALRLPPDLLLSGFGRLPEDVRTTFENNSVAAVAAIRSRAEAHAITYPKSPTRILTELPAATQAMTKASSERINVQKTSSSYRAHSYHTKVPPEAIRPFIQSCCPTGGTVFDPFCGSGMTGVAALMEGRNAVLSDLSPAAVHIARNYTTPCDPTVFSKSLLAVKTAMDPTIAWLYQPLGSDDMVEYTTWSDVFRCGACSERMLYWNVVQTVEGSFGDFLVCPRCKTQARKTDLEWIGEEAVESHTSRGSTRINSHAPTRAELGLIEELATAPIPYWTPEVSFGREREMWRAAHRSMNITSASGFFTHRNLYALAALRHAIIQSSEGRVREALMFAFTAAVNRASRRYQWNAKRPTNVMTGTLYISSLRYEWNVWSLFRRKAADVLRYYQSFPRTACTAEVFQRSATDLDCMPDRSVDMVFMDPPFGANIFYADSSLLWEAWLGQLTDQASEIVVNKHRSSAEGGKNIADYGDLMRRSFEQSARVLKRGGRAVLAFSNSDDRVWSAIQAALANAGFEQETVHVLSKGQPSIKGVKGVTGKEHVTTLDLILCLKHRASVVATDPALSPPATLIDQAIRDVLIHPRSDDGFRIDEIYSAVVRAVISASYSVSGITMPSIAQRCAELGAREEQTKWTLPPVGNPAVKPDFLDGYLSKTSELPAGGLKRGVAKPLAQLQVVGGRGSPFYLAHSYHTKVPPESIAPFIEHYTKPGDVVLDPFCGSGMTGVTAALSGRKIILNDLSPAAVHLAWNHTRPCDPEELGQAFTAIEASVTNDLDRLYRTTHTDGSPAIIHWTLWSTRHKCYECRKEFLLWAAIDRAAGRLGSTIPCPHCKKVLQRSRIRATRSEPAWIAYEAIGGKRFEKVPSKLDITHALSFKRDAIKEWYPLVPCEPDREMYIRCALQLQNIESVADFYTPRNLQALSLLWNAVQGYPNERLRRALAFAFTNTAWHGTRMRRFNARGGQRPLTGTLYIPQLSSEANVLEVMRNKIAQLQRYYRAYRPHGVSLPAVRLGSAAKLDGIPDGSIDYIFTDPPFGSNIFYADCNLIWESWLGRLTERSDEAVVNRSLAPDRGGKTLGQYGDLISRSFTEMARVLKPGGWATVVFHNTDAAVWQCIRDAASAAGFAFHEASSLDRQQQSHKGYKGRSGTEDVAHFDVVFNLRKTTRNKMAKTRKVSKVDLRLLLERVAADTQFAKRGLQGVHAEVMRQLASDGEAIFVSYAEIRSEWERLTGSATTN